jgi:hypothetical protein
LLENLLAGGMLSREAKPARELASTACISDLDDVRALLQAALPGTEVHMVARVQCTGTSVAAYEAVRESLGPEHMLWHGTSWDSVANIARHGFNRAYAYGAEARHGSRLGRGCYFAEEPSYALRFCGRGEERKAIFLAGVLPGRVTRGAKGLIEPPIVDSSGARYDSTVDDEKRPRVFCVFRDFQAMPLYLAMVT